MTLEHKCELVLNSDTQKAERARDIAALANPRCGSPLLGSRVRRRFPHLRDLLRARASTRTAYSIPTRQEDVKSYYLLIRPARSTLRPITFPGDRGSSATAPGSMTSVAILSTSSMRRMGATSPMAWCSRSRL